MTYYKVHFLFAGSRTKPVNDTAGSDERSFMDSIMFLVPD